VTARGLDLTGPGRSTIAGAPEGLDAKFLTALAGQGIRKTILHIAENDLRMEFLLQAIRFFDGSLDLLAVPAWDCVPYDRVSPNSEAASRRLDGLLRLADPEAPRPAIVLTTVNAVLQRVPPRGALQGQRFLAKAGAKIDVAALETFLARNGYARSGTVREPGEFALRGGIIDVFPAGHAVPLRLDLFGDEIETIRQFDPLNQRTTGEAKELKLAPASELPFDEAAIQRFRTGYRELFGAATRDDLLYEAISAGRRFPGMEHWLPLFYDRLETLFEYLPDAIVTLDPQCEQGVALRFEQIADHYAARRDQPRSSDAPRYNAVPPERMFLDRTGWQGVLAKRTVGELSAFAALPEAKAIDIGGKRGPEFAFARKRSGGNPFTDLTNFLVSERAQGRRCLIAAYSAGARDRLAGLLRDHAVQPVEKIDGYAAACQLPAGVTALAILPIEHGFTSPDLVLVSEQDILGERLVRPVRRKHAGAVFIAELSSLSEGDLVVHAEHGIGRYEGLVTIEVAGAPHDCLKILYAEDARLFLPVENLELLTRFGSEEVVVPLDRLGGAHWQSRKAKVKERLKELAHDLIRVAADRALIHVSPLVAMQGAYDEFCARFPYAETDDQERAIEETLADFSQERPTDRLICGDVGFGKTEVALRAAFVAAMTGMQVAVVVPTTLLARQHFKTFNERFQGFPVRLALLSRLVSAKEAKHVVAELAEGRIDIVIGTHALLADRIKFKSLGLLIVDEEQHFGVAQKEKLKQIKSDIRVLTLTATPIPRTLQLSLAGVRDMSVIATPPVDRLAIRPFVLPYDPLIIREAIMRERLRGGQTFYVCPRIEDLPKIAERLAKLVPEIRFVTAHGKLGSAALEKAVAAFYDGSYDLLLSTAIIEAGLDLPRANTIIVHRAEMFGLAQLYQLRGRVGRSKQRAYAYFTVPQDRKLGASALRRLEVMQTLDTLGAGFTLASHDLDIRGAGNLLGEEQSGHVREVGIELYQHLLEEAVAEARGAKRTVIEWTPQIAIGSPVLIPEAYVSDLDVRLALYRRASSLAERPEIDSFAAELVDRFGSLPPEVENLLKIVAIKQLCRNAGVERVEVGPKGAVLSFRNNSFANPAALVAFIGRQTGTVKLRPDHRLVVQRPWDDPREQLLGLERLLAELGEVAQGAGVPAAAAATRASASAIARSKTSGG
jgi:transcription-repair coupling factor (superfamily II helicase)